MIKKDILDFASKLYTTAYNRSAGKITKKQADTQLYDATHFFIEKLKKDPGYYEGRIIH